MGSVKSEQEIWIPWYGKHLNWLMRGKLLEDVRFHHSKKVPDMNWFMVLNLLYLILTMIIILIFDFHIAILMAYIAVFIILEFLLMKVLTDMCNEEFICFRRDGIYHIHQKSVLVLTLVGLEDVISLGRSIEKIEEEINFEIVEGYNLLFIYDDHTHLRLRFPGKINILEEIDETMDRYFLGNQINFNRKNHSYYLEKKNVHELNLEEEEQGLKIIEYRLSMDPDNPELLGVKGKWLSSSGDEEGAVPWLEKAVKGGCRDLKTHAALIYLLMKRDSTRKMARCAEAYYQLYPYDLSIIMLYITALIGKSSDKAITFLDRVIEGLEKNPYKIVDSHDAIVKLKNLRSMIEEKDV